PYIVDRLRTAEGADKLPYLDALTRLSPEVVPPLVAALDSGDPDLQRDILIVLRRRGAVEATPFLWYLAGSPAAPEPLRKQAAETLAAFLSPDPARPMSPSQ